MRWVTRVCLVALLVMTSGLGLARPVSALAAEPAGAVATSGITPGGGATAAASVPLTLTQATPFSGSTAIWSPNGTTQTWNVTNVTWNTGEQSTDQTTSIPGGVNFRFNSSGCNSDPFYCAFHIWEYIGYDVAYKRVGIAASAHTNGNITFKGQTANMQANAATNVAYPGNASISYPAPKSFPVGGAVSLGGTWAYTTPAINAATTSGDFKFLTNLGLGGGASATAYLAYASPGGAIIPDFNWNSGDVTIFSASPFTPLPACCPLTPISGEFNTFEVTPGPATTINPDGSMVKSGSNQFSHLTFDIDGVASKFGAPPVSKFVDMSGIGVPIQVGYNIFDAKTPIELYAEQTLVFRQDGVRIRLTFDAPVGSIGGAFLAKDPGNGWVEIRPGQNPQVTMPAGRTTPITVTPTVSIDNPRLTNHTTLRTDTHVTLSSGGFDFGLPGFEVFPAIGGYDTGLAYPTSVEVGFQCDLEIAGHCVFGHPTVEVTWHEIYLPTIGPWNFGGVNFHWGPLWSQDYGDQQQTDTLADDTRSMSFSPVTLNTFQLVPAIPPVASANGPYTVNEGSDVTLSSAGSSSPSGNPITIQWDFDNNGTYDATGPTATYHAVNGPSTHPVRVHVCDDVGQCTDATSTIFVNNVLPVVNGGADRSGAEGAVISVPLAITDAGVLDTIVNFTQDWGDNSFTPSVAVLGASPQSLTVTHVYADNGTYTATFCVSDNDAGPAKSCDTVIITITNVAPTIVAGADRTLVEGDVVSLTSPFNDKGTKDTHTATINWGDGTPTDSGTVAEAPFGPPGSTGGANGTVSGSHVYADNGLYTVTVCVKDDDGASACDTLKVTITNAAPSITFTPIGTAAEGALVPLTFAFNDKGTADTHTATINWGDGTPIDAGVVTEAPFGPPGSTVGANGTVAGSHVYADNGTYTVTMCVTDDDGGTTCAPQSLVITNVAPTVHAGADRAVDEGTLITLAPSTFNDKGTKDTHTATIDWGDGTALGTGVVTESPFGPPGSTAGLDGTATFAGHVYADNGTYTATVCVIDDDGAKTCDTLTITVANVAPTVNAGADRTVDEGTVIALAPATFNDKGTLDTHTATIKWGDGTPADVGIVAETPFGPPGSTAGANGTVSGSHVYADNGAYTATVCVTDDDGATTCSSLTITVRNVAPTVVAAAPVTIEEGATLSLTTATFNDKGTLDTHTATIDWGSGPHAPGQLAHEAGAVTESPFGPPGSTAGANGSVAGTHIYDDNATNTVTTCVTDDDGATTCASFTVTVVNVPPTAHLVGGPVTQYWGVAIPQSANIADPSTLDTAAGFTNHWSWGDGTAGFTDHTLSPAHATHTYANVGTYTIAFDATDKDGGNDARSHDSKSVTIVRRPTTLSCTAGDALYGYTSTLSATLVDPIDRSNQRLDARTIRFATGAYAWTASTNSGGLATSQTPTQLPAGTPPPLAPGRWTITTNFDGDTNYEPSTATCSFTVSNTSGLVQTETRHGTGGSLGMIQSRIQSTGGTPTGTLRYVRSPSNIDAARFIGFAISPDGTTAWVSGVGTDGRSFVLFARAATRGGTAQLWIDGVLQNGDGVAISGPVIIR